MTTWVVACGGEVRTGDPDDPDTAEVPPDTEETPKSTGGASGAGDGSHLPQVDLPECKKGVPPPGSATQGCSYIYEKLCYESKLAACACACKKQSGTVCSSGFPRDGVPTAVSCF